MEKEIDLQREKEEQKKRMEKYNQKIEEAAKAQLTEIVQQLITLRKEQGKTQKDIAEATGIAAPNIARVESCKRIPSVQVLKKYADAVGYGIHIQLVRES